METKKIDIILELENSDLSEELKFKTKENYQISDKVNPLNISNATVIASRFVDPITVSALITVTYLIKRLTDFWIKDKERGVQIDTRTIPPTISRIAGVPAGFFVLIDNSGKAITKKVNYDGDNTDIVNLVAKTLNK